MADRPKVGHVAHDELLIAAWVSGDTEPEDAARATDIASRCDECRALATDLRGLRSAMRSLPSPSRTRDFRLTPADAERLRSRPRWLGRWSAVSRAGITRPLAGAMTALGLAGLLLTTVPLGGAGVGGEDRDAARLEMQGSGSSGAGVAPAGGASAAAAPAASREGAVATEQPLPAAAAASGGQESVASPVPGDATASADGGGFVTDLHATAPVIAQASAPATAGADRNLRGAGTSTTPVATDLTRPVLAVASAALLVGGLLLLFVTRRRRPSAH